MSRVGYVQLLRENPRYRWLWFAEIISFLGDWFNTIALYTIVQEISGSGKAVAGVMVAKTLPVFLMAPIAGPLVDRFDRRTLMIVSDVGRAVLAVGLVVAHRSESLVALYGCLVLMMALAGVFIPARSAAIPQLTTPAQLAVANALSGGTWSVMLALGAAFGGWVTATVGTDVSLLLDGGTFVLSAAFLFALPRLPAPGAEAPHHDRSFLAGLRYLVADRGTFALAALKPLMALGGGVFVLIPIYGTTVFPDRGGPFWVGMIYSARGLGALVGSVVLIRIFGDASRTMRRIILFAFPTAGLFYFLLGRATSLEAAAFTYFVAAIASGANWVMSGTLLQREVDPRFLGRVSAVEFGVMTLVVSAMGWMTGSLLDTGDLTPRTAATLSGALLALPALAWLGYLLFERRLIAQAREGEGSAPLHPGAAPELFEAAPGEEDEGISAGPEEGR